MFAYLYLDFCRFWNPLSRRQKGFFSWWLHFRSKLFIYYSYQCSTSQHVNYKDCLPKKHFLEILWSDIFWWNLFFLNYINKHKQFIYPWTCKIISLYKYEKQMCKQYTICVNTCIAIGRSRSYCLENSYSNKKCSMKIRAR